MDIIERLLAILFLLNVNIYQGQCTSYPPGVRLPGCFRNTGRGRDMGPIEISKSLKPAECIKACVEKKNLYAGKQGSICRCGTTYGRLPKVDPKECSFNCLTGIPKGECGGNNLFTVYSLHHYYKDKPCKKIPEALRGSWYASTVPERQVLIFTNAILWRSTDKKDTFSAYVEVKSIYCVSAVVARVVGRLHGESQKNHVCITLKAGTDATVNATVTRTDKGGPNECDIPESSSQGLYEEFALSEKPLPKQIAFSPLGCFLDTFFQRRMMYDSLYSQQPMTRSLCSRYCHVRQTYYFAVRDTYWCDCGFIIPDKPEKKCEAECGLKSGCMIYKYSILMFKFDNVQKASAAEVKKHELGVYVEQNTNINNGMKYLTAYKEYGTFAMVGETCYMLCGFYNISYSLVQDRLDQAICYCNFALDMKKIKTAKSLDGTLKFDWRKEKVAINAWAMFTMYRPDFRRPEYKRKTKPLPDAPPSSVLTQVLSNTKLAEDLIHNVDIWSGRAKGILRERASNVVPSSSRKPGHHKPTVSKKPEHHKPTVSRKPEHQTSTVSKKPEHQKSTVSKKPEHHKSTVSKKPEHHKPTVSKKPEHQKSTVSKKPEHDKSTVSKEPEHHKPTVSKKPEHHKPTVSTKPEHHKSTVSKKPEHQKSTVSKKPEHHKPTVSTKPGHHKPTVSKKPEHHKPTVSGGSPGTSAAPDAVTTPKVKVEAQHVDVVDQLPGNSKDGSAAALKKIKAQVEAAIVNNPMIALGAGAAVLVVIVIIIIICCKKKKSKKELPTEQQQLLYSGRPAIAYDEVERMNRGYPHYVR